MGGGKGRERRGEEKRILGLLECAERERERGLLCHRKRKRLDGHQHSPIQEHYTYCNKARIGN